VEVEPNPVAVGDTVTFITVIEDSLETGFQYTWVPPGRNDFSRTDTNQFRWPASVKPGSYTLLVEVRHPSTSKKAQQGTEITVIEKQTATTHYTSASRP
jgi:hypothetical protein